MIRVPNIINRNKKLHGAKKYQHCGCLVGQHTCKSHWCHTQKYRQPQLSAVYEIRRLFWLNVGVLKHGPPDARELAKMREKLSPALSRKCAFAHKQQRDRSVGLTKLLESSGKSMFKLRTYASMYFLWSQLCRQREREREYSFQADVTLSGTTTTTATATDNSIIIQLQNNKHNSQIVRHYTGLLVVFAFGFSTGYTTSI